jgi:hypothetical protein
LAILEPTLSAVLDRFIQEERLLEIKQRRLVSRATLKANSAIRLLSPI